MYSSQTVKVGIFGGMGAIAGSAFYYKLTQSFQGLREELQPMIFLYSDPTMPRRDASVEMALNCGYPITFFSKVMRGIAFFKMQNVDFVVVPCNTFHYFHTKLQRESGVRILNMVDIICNYVLQQHASTKQVALLSTAATARAGIYTKVFANNGIEVVLPKLPEREKITFVIEQVKRGKANDIATVTALNSVIHTMLQQGIDVIILGCTELPEVSITIEEPCHIIDTTQVLVAGTVQAVQAIQYKKQQKYIYSRL